MMVIQRKKHPFFWPVTILLIVATFVTFNNFYVQVVDVVVGEKSMAEAIKAITADDLIAMVFWEKDNSAHIWNDLIEERKKGLRDQERPRHCFAGNDLHSLVTNN